MGPGGKPPARYDREQVGDALRTVADELGDLGAALVRNQPAAAGLGSVDAVDQRSALQPRRLAPPVEDRGGLTQVIEQVAAGSVAVARGPLGLEERDHPVGG